MTREEILEYFKDINHAYNDCTRYDTLKRMIDELQEPCDDMGEVSDGYHTFNQLYHQRAVLFATIVNQNKDKSWKSFKHSDGNYCFDSNGEWFIVGIDTPQGSYTYHYAKEYWDMFDCEELECGKEWDGHTEEDVTRLLSLQNEPCTDCISRKTVVEILNHQRFGISKMSWDIISEKLSELPPVTPQPKTRWIPVSERLPEFMHHEDEFDGEYYESERVLIYTEDIHEPEYGPVCIAQYEKYHSEGRWVEGWYSEPISSLLSAVAWMPLPERYEASPTGEEANT